MTEGLMLKGLETGKYIIYLYLELWKIWWDAHAVMDCLTMLDQTVKGCVQDPEGKCAKQQGCTNYVMTGNPAAGRVMDRQKLLTANRALLRFLMENPDCERKERASMWDGESDARAAKDITMILNGQLKRIKESKVILLDESYHPDLYPCPR